MRRDQADYQREYEELALECEKLNTRLQAIDVERRNKADRARQMELFLTTLEGQAGRIKKQTDAVELRRVLGNLTYLWWSPW